MGVVSELADLLYPHFVHWGPNDGVESVVGCIPMPNRDCIVDFEFDCTSHYYRFIVWADPYRKKRVFYRNGYCETSDIKRSAMLLLAENISEIILALVKETC